jgi:hypothetical protein
MKRLFKAYLRPSLEGLGSLGDLAREDELPCALYGWYVAEVSLR